jgi:ABC-2 type transport system permease protein
MKKGFYIRLAGEGISKNRKLYFPYILTCICMIMMYYIVSFLSISKELASIRGGEMLQGLLSMGVFVVAVFALIFLYYTNSFLIRKRKKELGLYNILGMGKRNLVRILLWENILTAVISLVIGIVFGTVLFHGIIECIYQFDIRGMWSHWKQMLATMAVVLCLTGSFYLDLYGYDSYVPAAGGVSSVMVEDDGFTYRKEYFWGDSEQSITGKDMENVLALIKDAVKEERHNRFPGGPEQATDGAVTDSSPTIYYTDNGANAAEQEGRKYVGVTYYMKNGETIKRRFDMSDVQANAIMEAACHSESFRKSVYSLYTADWSKIKSISWNSFIENQNLRLTEEEQKQFLTIYLSELDTLDYETMRTVLPVAELNIEHEVEDRMDFTDDFYYIYPSFTKTLAFLESKGCAVDRTLADINITQIDVNDYTGDEPKNWTVTDPAIIQSVKGKLTISNSNFTYYSSGYEGESPTPDYDITVYYNEGYGENTLNVWTDAETLKTLTAGESGE